MGSFSSVVSENVTHEIEYQPKGRVEIFYDIWDDLIFCLKQIHIMYIVLSAAYIRTIARFLPGRDLTMTLNDDIISARFGRCSQHELCF